MAPCPALPGSRRFGFLFGTWAAQETAGPLSLRPENKRRWNLPVRVVLFVGIGALLGRPFGKFLPKSSNPSRHHLHDPGLRRGRRADPVRDLSRSRSWPRVPGKQDRRPPASPALHLASMSSDPRPRIARPIIDLEPGSDHPGLRIRRINKPLVRMVGAPLIPGSRLPSVPRVGRASWPPLAPPARGPSKRAFAAPIGGADGGPSWLDVELRRLVPRIGLGDERTAEMPQRGPGRMGGAVA